MKTLFLILITASLAYGQDYKSQRDSIEGLRLVQPIYREYTLPYMPSQITWGQPEPLDLSKIIIPEIVKLWDEYKIGCYNDSTLIGRGYWVIDMGARWWVERDTDFLGNKPAPGQWKHRQPSLEGFIEYLRKKK